ncbi:MAG: hypothetical protein LBE38_02710 [Deltaproteobacteria bacterium]|nr:hypothetical protein [Deltaproteobacteria bacterium]
MPKGNANNPSPAAAGSGAKVLPIDPLKGIKLPQACKIDSHPEWHVFLTGFMAAGKTETGKILAKLLGRDFVDLDRALEERFQRRIPEVFNDPSLGEKAFRKAELELILAKINSRRRPQVIALGGGAITSSQARLVLKNKAHTYYLMVSDPLVLWERANNTVPSAQLRPLAEDYAKFSALYKKRIPYYQETGIPVDAQNQSPLEVALSIKELLLKKEKWKLSSKVDYQSQLKVFANSNKLYDALGELVGTRKALLLLDHALYREEPLWESILGANYIYKTRARGEKAKTFSELESLLAKLATLKLSRSDYLVVRGGGSLSDLGGLAAGLYKRGIKFLILPSTLLAAVDAAIGGKTAINFQADKNQIGLFYLPQEVWLDAETLGNLPQGLLEEGLSEAYKIGLLRDQGLASLIVREIESLIPVGPADKTLARDLPLLLEVAWRAAVLKMDLVSLDLKEEKGIRDILNLGHTFGHVLESYYLDSPIPVSHGRAVAYGMAVALELSAELLQLEGDFARQGQSLCLRLAGGGFPPVPPLDYLKEHLESDKKIRDGTLKFVLLASPEEPRLLSIDPQKVYEAAQKLNELAKTHKLKPLSCE